MLWYGTFIIKNTKILNQVLAVCLINQIFGFNYILYEVKDIQDKKTDEKLIRVSFVDSFEIWDWHKKSSLGVLPRSLLGASSNFHCAGRRPLVAAPNIIDVSSRASRTLRQAHAPTLLQLAVFVV
jgi:hypothetical protein